MVNIGCEALRELVFGIFRASSWRLQQMTADAICSIVCPGHPDVAE
jgi:hypothetical protein